MPEALYVISGHDIDPTNWQESKVSLVTRTPEQAEQWLIETVDENRGYLREALLGRDIHFSEIEHRRDGHLWKYEAIQEFDISTPDGKAAWLECPRLRGCIKPECYNPTIGGDTTRIQCEKVVDIFIRRIDI